MARYMVLHCAYDSRVVYAGMRMWVTEAANMEEAEKNAYAWFEERDNLELIRYDRREYRIIEIADEIGPRIYSIRERKRL